MKAKLQNSGLGQISTGFQPIQSVSSAGLSPGSDLSIPIAPEIGVQAGTNWSGSPTSLENQFRLLAEHAQVGMYVYQDGRVVYVNSKCAEIFGYTPDEVYSLGLLENFIADSDLGLVQSNLRQRLRGGIASLRYSFHGKRKDGRLIDVEVQSVITQLNGKPAIFGTLLDITESMQRDRALRQNEERFRSLTEKTSDWIWEIDTEWRYVYASPKLKDLLGYEPQEVLGKTPFALMPVEEAARIQMGLQGFMQSPRSFERLENINLHKNGRRVVLETSGVPVYDVSGQFCGYRGIDRDITQRKQAEEALRGSETRFRELVDLLPQIVYEIDRHGNLTFANQKAFDLFGYTQREFGQGLNVLQMLVPADRDQAERNIEKVLAGERLPGLEYTALRKDGSTFPVLIYCTPILCEEQVIGARGILVDMTERRLAEEMLRKLSRAVAQSPVSVVITDNQGNIEYVNPKFTQLTGYELEEVVGKNPRILKSGRTPPTVYEALWNAITSGQEWRGEFHNRKKTGEYYREYASISPLTNSEGIITHFVAVKEDITERKRVEEALRESEEKYRSLYSSMSEGVALHEMVYDQKGHPIDYRIMDVNPAYESIFGLTKEQAIGHRGSTVFRSVPPPHLDTYEQVARTGIPLSFQASMESLQKTFHVSVFSPSRGKVATVLEDISERLRLEAQLLQAQKLEMVGQLAGGIAHDFNNLLTVINCYSQLLAFRYNPETAIRKDIDQIRMAGTQAAQLTSQLLAFSRKQVLEPMVLNLNDVVGKMEKMLRRLITENIELVASLNARMARVKADPTQLEQVIVNLVLNSRDALPQGGKIVIETSDAVLDEAYAQQHDIARPGDYVMMSVSDNGCGMNAQVQARIFEPFFTTKKQGQGTGLGLSTVYGTVKQSGGHVEVYSEEGRGTIFRVYFPSVEEVLDERKEEPVEEPAIGGKETVLLVEDDDNVRNLVREILKDRGYTVLEAADSAQALGITRQQGPIQLLLTDMVMPQMSGLQLAERLTALRPGIRVLYMSGYADDAVVQHGILEPGIAYLQKPFTSETLLRRVRKVLDVPSLNAPVLIVDDDPIIRELLHRTLEAAGYPVIEAQSGREALAQLEGRPVDLLITDLVMPDGEGLEIIQRFRRTFPALRIIAISGAFSGSFLKPAELLGANATLQKPFKLEVLLETVRKVLAEPR